ncbi:FlgO family outer membrane protein [Sphingomicrobium flavum]|uniref:FlgO family outer membrane protein n=1 Tax=Sphingomicrobium flavum TaxID=1229164 RepID=UPI0021AD5A52|nr:FlgO family outer membrane protein [Sphingomicrobium flavum]
MADIFLSYARADQPRVEKLAAALEEAGYTLWWDKHLRGGHQFSEDIEAAIAEAKAVLVVWSKDAVKSEWVRDEAAYGRDHNKLVPVRIDDTLPPMGYRQRHAIDLNGDDAMAALTEALDALVGGHHEAHQHAANSGKSKHAPILVGAALAVALLGATGYFVTQQGEPTTATAEVEDRDSIAVLPFVAQSSDEDDQFFADGITEEIMNRLDALGEFRVLPRTTVFSLRDSGEDVDALTKRLNVDYIVEGSLRRGGDDVRVTARLIRTGTGETVWSYSYDGSRDDVLQFQSDIAEKVASSLDVLLDERLLARMEDAGINDPEAFALGAKATELYSRAHGELTDLSLLYEATQLYDQAFAKAPKLVEAQTQASDLYSHILLDSFADITHPELPQEVTANPREQLLERLAIARRNASTRRHRLAIDLYAAAFSDDWSDVASLSRQAHVEAQGCSIPNWNTFLVAAFDKVDFIADTLLAQQECYTADSIRMYNSFWELGRVDRLDDARATLQRLKRDGDKTSDLESVLAIWEGDAERALRLARRSDRLYHLQTARAFAGREIDKVREFLATQNVPIYEQISFYALIGDRDAANRLARKVDARRGGATALQIAADFCNCGAPWDIENTPNYAAMLEKTPYSWPPRKPLNWPMKDW